MNYHPRTQSRAFTLVEVTLALGLIGFGLVVILGLLPSGMGLIKDDSSELTLVNIAAAIRTDIRTVPAGSSISPRYGIPIGTVNSGKAFFDLNGEWLGSGLVNQYPTAIYAAAWDVRARSGSAPPTVLVTLTWPALAAKPTGWMDLLLVIPNNPTTDNGS